MFAILQSRRAYCPVCEMPTLKLANITADFVKCTAPNMKFLH